MLFFGTSAKGFRCLPMLQGMKNISHDEIQLKQEKNRGIDNSPQRHRAADVFGGRTPRPLLCLIGMRPFRAHPLLLGRGAHPWQLLGHIGGTHRSPWLLGRDGKATHLCWHLGRDSRAAHLYWLLEQADGTSRLRWFLGVSLEQPTSMEREGS